MLNLQLLIYDSGETILMFLIWLDSMQDIVDFFTVLIIIIRQRKYSPRRLNESV